MGMTEQIHTRIWREDPEADDPRAAAVCRCHGYDVHGDLLGKVRWVEYLYLLFQGEPPSREQARLLEDLAVLLANPGPRDPAVHAAMAGGVGGSTAAACLAAALAVGAGGLGGAREVYRFMRQLAEWGDDLAAWQRHMPQFAQAEAAEVWSSPEHPPGFDPQGVSCPTPVRHSLAHLARLSPGRHLAWLEASRIALEAVAARPLAMPAVVAAALLDLGFDPEQGEMLTLLLRLPGAAVHALEQRALGYRRFPFFTLELENPPTSPAEARGTS